MRRLVYSLACLIMVALVVSGLWAAKAINFSDADEIVETDSASSAADLSTRDMALQSQLIVTGRCVDTSSTWIENGRVLVTLATVAVDEVIKGAQTSTVTVVLPGGVDANRRIPVAMTYAGAPTITPQEEVFLFLASEEGTADRYSVMGFAEGKLSVVEDEAGQKLVSRDLTKVRGQQGPGAVRGNRQFVPLSEFKAKVRNYLGQ